MISCFADFNGKSDRKTSSTYSLCFLLYGCTVFDGGSVVCLALISCESVKNGTQTNRLSGIFSKNERRGQTDGGRIPNNKKVSFLANQPRHRRVEIGLFPPKQIISPIGRYCPLRGPLTGSASENFPKNYFF